MENAEWEGFDFYNPIKGRSLKQGNNPLYEFVEWMDGSFGISIVGDDVERYKGSELDDEEVLNILEENLDSNSSEDVTMEYSVRPDNVLMYDIKYETGGSDTVRIHGNQKLSNPLNQQAETLRNNKKEHLAIILEDIAESQRHT